MRFAPLARWVMVALLALAVAAAVWWFMRPDPAPPVTVSQGEVELRVSGPGTVADEPPIVFADEPTAALDTERGMKVMELLRRVAREKRSAVTMS